MSVVHGEAAAEFFGSFPHGLLAYPGLVSLGDPASVVVHFHEQPVAVVGYPQTAGPGVGVGDDVCQCL